MHTRTYATTVIVLAIIIIAAVAMYRTQIIRPPAIRESTGQPSASAVYACDGGKFITANYYTGDSTTATAGEPPKPGGSVALTLSDGRAMTLPETISADGARYANSGESLIFWNKGNGAFVTENGQQTYNSCVATAVDTGGLSQVFASSAKGFSIRYPSGYVVDEAYHYQLLGPGKEIAGVKFGIPVALAQGTNLGADTYASVEEQPQAHTCSAALFLETGAKATTVGDNGVTYSVASTTGAGAGNRYEETVYALPDSSPCIAIRYFVHYSAFENYPAGTIAQFDKTALLAQFDAIRRTLTIAR